MSLKCGLNRVRSIEPPDEVSMSVSYNGRSEMLATRNVSYRNTVRGPFEIRSGSLRDPFGICSGSVRDLFGIRSGFVWTKIFGAKNSKF